jgi:hypothetical protein
MPAQRYHKYMAIWLLLGISVAGTPTIAHAEVHVEGSLAAVHVTTDKDAIPDVLSALETTFNLGYHTSFHWTEMSAASIRARWRMSFHGCSAATITSSPTIRERSMS